MLIQLTHASLKCMALLLTEFHLEETHQKPGYSGVWYPNSGQNLDDQNQIPLAYHGLSSFSLQMATHLQSWARVFEMEIATMAFTS